MKKRLFIISILLVVGLLCFAQSYELTACDIKKEGFVLGYNTFPDSVSDVSLIAIKYTPRVYKEENGATEEELNKNILPTLMIIDKDLPDCEIVLIKNLLDDNDCLGVRSYYRAEEHKAMYGLIAGDLPFSLAASLMSGNGAILGFYDVNNEMQFIMNIETTQCTDKQLQTIDTFLKKIY